MKIDGKKIWVAGHRGMVGSAIVRYLKNNHDCQVLTVTREQVDLTNPAQVETWLSIAKPEIVVLAAAKVGGIVANDTQPANFIYENLMIQSNVIHLSYKAGVKRLLNLGSSCIYPKMAKQPIKEDALLTGPLEKTNEAYAIAKIAGIKMCQAYRKQYTCNFISAMPTNLYGPNDNFHPLHSHVIPGMIYRFHQAKIRKLPEVKIWGTGKPKREFLHVDDLSRACAFLIENYNSSEIINVGTGKDITIKELATKIKKVVGYTGKITWDTSKPDGTPRKLMDTTRINELGWYPKIDLDEGLKDAYNWYLSNVAK